MAQTERAAIYRALKGAGVEFTKHYREYSVEELRALAGEHGVEVKVEGPAPVPPRETDDDLRAQLRALTQVVTQLAKNQVAATAARPVPVAAAPAAQPASQAPTPAQPGTNHVSGLDPTQHAGVEQNSVAKDEVLFVDEHGNEWFQREVTKPGYAKPRGRRVLRTYDAGVKRETIKVGEYEETFEVSGDVKSTQATEIKVTLPSYQCGIYKPKNMPFRVHTYNGMQGFDREDVQRYYGGRNLVPSTIKSTYVHTDWCYDIQSVIKTIEDEYRERVLGTTVTQRGL